MSKRSSFSPSERDAVYRVIYARRDIRSFRPEPVPKVVLDRILEAAHHAPSVGFMQPWNFILIRDVERRRRLLRHVREVSEAASLHYEDDRQARYLSLKLQGILDAPLNVLITCDTQRDGEHVLGRSTIREMDVYSTCLAVQNFWLAARSEGVGVGWISILENSFLTEQFQLPPGVVPVAYLAVGYPVEFPETPMLEQVGWRRRDPVGPRVFEETWGGGSWASRPDSSSDPLIEPESDPAQLQEDARRRNEDLTKPPGSLGRLEELALQLSQIQGRVHPRSRRRALLLMAGDHGVTAERVSAYRPEVTTKMVIQFIAGGGAVSALARDSGVPITVVDMGVDHDFEAATGLQHRKVRRGTRNFSQQAAMTASELELALQQGREACRSLGELDVLALGEMGIGNSSSAAAIACAMLSLSPESIVGRGTGVGEQTLARKREVIQRAIDLHGLSPDSPLEVLRCVGGYEIAGLVGAMLEASDRGQAVLLDGFITGAAALIALALRPSLQPQLIAGHESAERGHALILEALSLRPLLRLEMRLGEGTGAVLAMRLLDGACRVLQDMATFEEAGMEHPLEPGCRQ